MPHFVNRLLRRSHVQRKDIEKLLAGRLASELAYLEGFRVANGTPVFFSIELGEDWHICSFKRVNLDRERYSSLERRLR